VEEEVVVSTPFYLPTTLLALPADFAYHPHPSLLLPFRPPYYYYHHNYYYDYYHYHHNYYYDY